MWEVIPFPSQSNQVQGGQIAQAIEAQIQKPSIKAQLKTTVSQLAILAPSIFMKPEDAAKMVQMLYEERSELLETQALKPLIEKVQQDAANTNQVFIPQNKAA